MISRAKATDYQKKAKERTKKLSQQLQSSDNQQNNSYEFDGLTYLESLADQLTSENTNPVTYFFNDDTEVEITREMAEAFLARFGELSEENMEKMMDMIPSSSDVMGLFMQM